MLKRLNVGSGDIPTIGWVNYDNSLTVRIAGWPGVDWLMGRLGLLSPKQQGFIRIIRQVGIKYANAVHRIPELDDSVEVLYTCHMLEHLNQREAGMFLREARRVLAPGGIIRVAVPDLRFHIENYMAERDADAFVEGIFMASANSDSWLGKLKYLLVGERHHLWMYDGESLCKLLLKAGFENPQVMPSGETTIPNPGELDLVERVPESVFVEAVNP